MPQTIEWTRQKLNRFKKAYQEAKDNAKATTDIFEFEGHQFVISYAKYLIIHLENQLKR